MKIIKVIILMFGLFNINFINSGSFVSKGFTLASNGFVNILTNHKFSSFVFSVFGLQAWIEGKHTAIAVGQASKIEDVDNFLNDEMKNAWSYKKTLFWLSISFLIFHCFKNNDFQQYNKIKATRRSILDILNDSKVQTVISPRDYAVLKLSDLLYTKQEFEGARTSGNANAIKVLFQDENDLEYIQNRLWD